LLSGKFDLTPDPPVISRISEEGITGRLRFERVIANHPTQFTRFSEGYDEWLLALPEDPKDIEYTRLLREAKAEARERQREREKRKREGVTEDEDIRRETRTIQEQAKYRELHGSPIIQGFPVGLEHIFDETGLSQESAFLNAYREANGIPLRKETAEIAAKSGFFVYVGETPDSKGGASFTRPTYMYVKDAEVLIAAMPEETIRKYQKMLDLPETGIVDPELQSLWNEAVETAARYAKAGRKVTPEFIFNTLVEELAKARRRGGGGGGGRQPLDAFDYYRAAMMVLPDISGVQA